MLATCENFTMQKLSQWPLADRQRIHGVFTDIDDTLTTDGSITPDALAALHDLKAAGINIIAITGRPVGWCEPLVLAWPVDAIVAENGAVLLQNTHQNSLQPNEYGRNKLLKSYLQSETLRAANYDRMQQVGQRVLREVPGALLAQDSAGRETDMAIDHNEFTQLPQEKIEQVVALLQSEGMNATISSIHINGWFGTYNKLEGARWAVRQLWGRDLDNELDRWVYVGDSTNDQLMFKTFTHSVGVANIDRFLPALSDKPRYLTQGARGAGFTEVAAAILAARQMDVPA
jgi:HAD superfamily hydrolase (TIGR01484 family)